MSLTRATSPSSTPDRINPLEENDRIRNEDNYTSSGEKVRSHGVTYHNHVIMLYACKFMAKENFNFNLTCEVVEGGKFDDVLIFYVHDDRVLCRMIQVKSKTDISNKLTKKMLGERNKPFDLNMYFLSYLEIKFKHNFEEKFNCEIEDLILHMNFDVEQELKDDLETYEDELLELKTCYRLKDGQTDLRACLIAQLSEFLRDKISPRGGKKKTIKGKKNKKTTTKRQDIVNEEGNNPTEYLKRLTPDDMKKCIDIFLEKLKFHVTHADKDKLEMKIKNEINRCMRKYKLKIATNSNQSVIVYTGLYNKVHAFHSDPKVAVLTDKQLVGWLKEVSGRSMTRLVAFHDMNLNVLTTRRYSVREESVERLKTDIERSDDEFVNIIANAGTVFTLIKLNDTFEGRKHHLITERQFLNISSAIEDDIEIERTEYLIVTCEDNKTTDRLLSDIEDLLERIRDGSEGVRNDLKKIILVSESSELSSNDTYTTIIDQMEWNDLERDTRKRIECESTICLQGREVKLADIEISNFSDLLNNEILYDVVYSAVTLGKAIDSENTCDISNFIERQISLTDKINKNIFKSGSKDDIFIISNINETECQRLNSTSRCSLISSSVANSQNVFYNLRNEHKYGNVTLLHHENDEFFYRECKSIDRLLPYVNENSHRLVELHRLTAIDNRIVLIIAEPGMGKSDLLTVLASRMIGETSSTLVVKINLNNCTERFNSLLAEKRTFTQSEAIDFIVETQLCNTEGYKNTFERNYFKRHFDLSDRIFILLDGFDEIAPDYREIVIDLIKLIKDINAVRLWLTSRPQEKKYLETELNTLSCALVRFTADDQSDFFLGYWNRHETDGQNACAKKFVERLIHVTSRSLRDNDQLMTGIPLQCRMLGEVYRGTFEEYFNSVQDDVDAYLPVSLDVLELYDKFVDKKRMIYVKEKSKWNETLTTNRIQCSMYRDRFYKTHSYFGLCAIFTDAHLDDILSEEDRKKIAKYIREVDSGNEKTGIIRVVENSRPAFIHKTFAEYFAARWLHYRIKNDGPDRRKKLIDFFKTHLFKPEFEMVRHFFDHLSAKGEIFKAILSNDESCLIKMLDADSSLVHSLADFHRNPLHICAAYKYNNLICILIEKGVQSMAEDSLCGWKPIEYACAVKNWKNVDTFLGDDTDDGTAFEYMQYKNILFYATEKDYLNLIKYLIKWGTSVSSVKNKNESSLHLDPDATREKNNDDGDAILHYAASRGNIEIVKMLIEANADTNFKNNRGRTPLFSAGGCGYLDVVKYLIEDADAATDIVDNGGMTVLHHAARKGYVDIVKALITAHADSNITSNDGYTPLHFAALFSDHEIVKCLIEDADARTDIMDCGKNTALHFAARDGNIHIVKLLVKANANSNIKNIHGYTPLHIAAQNGHYEMFKCLIEDADAATDIINSSGNTALHYAAEKGNVDIVRLLIKARVDSNIINGDGCTSLHKAAVGGHYDIFKCLTENVGAATDIVDNKGNTVLHYAAEGGNVDIVKLLIKANVDSNITNMYGRTSLHQAAMYGHYEVLKFLIEDTVTTTDILDTDGASVLHYAARDGNMDIVKLLIQMHVDVNITNNYGQTPLHLAGIKRHHEILKCLIENADEVIDIIDCLGNTALHHAAILGYVDIAKLLIKAHVDVNIKNYCGRTPLHLTALCEHYELLKFLIEDTDAATGVTDENGNTALHYAAQEGNVNVAKLLIESNVDSNITNKDGRAPLHLAAKCGHYEVLKFLIEDTDAFIDILDNDGSTPLLYAVIWEHMDIVKLLVKANADSNVTNNLGFTSLHFAAHRGYYEIFEYLIDNAGAVTGIIDIDGNTVLHHAAEEGKVDIVKLLIKAHFDADIINKDGRTPLHLAAMNGHYEIFKSLIEDADAATNIIDKGGNTALHHAAINGNMDIAKLLINAHIDSNIRNNDGRTPLLLTAMNDHYEIIKCLIEEADAAVDIIDCDGNTALHYAAERGNVDIVKLLMQVDSNITNNDGRVPLHFAAIFGHYEIFKCLTDVADAAYDIIDNKGNSALNHAARNGHMDIVTLLIKANVDSNTANDDGHTPLHLAAMNGHYEIFKYLIEDAGAATNIIDKGGNTALHHAARNGKVNLVKLLIKRHVDVNITNKDGCTSLHIAAMNHNYEIFKCLIEDAGPATYITDNDGNTVLHYAAISWQDNIANLLIEAHFNPNIPNNDGCTSLHLAAKNSRGEIIKCLIEKANAAVDIIDSYGNTALHYGAMIGHVDIVKLLIKAHVDVNIINKDGYAPLHLAARNGHYKIFKYLIEDTDAATDIIDSYGNTALHYAAVMGYVDIIRLLIKAHVDSNITNKEGCASLHLAAKNGRYEVFKCLIEEANAATDVIDSYGNTVLHYAAEKGNLNIAKLLIKAHVQVNITNNDGCTPLHSAAMNGNYNIFRYLMEVAEAATDVLDKNGNTLLHHATKGGNVNIANLIIKVQTNKT